MWDSCLKRDGRNEILGSDSLWQRGEGSECSRVSEAISCSTPQALVFSSQRSECGICHILVVTGHSDNSSLPWYPWEHPVLGTLSCVKPPQGLLSESSYCSGSQLEAFCSSLPHPLSVPQVQGTLGNVWGQFWSLDKNIQEGVGVLPTSN